MSRLAAASTIPVTNAAKQANTRKVMQDSDHGSPPPPTLVAGPSGMGQLASV
jgi:hypothetical protein